MITTAEELVTKVLARCFWPADGTAPLTDEEILAIADEEISGELWPTIILSHGDYYTLAKDYTITADQRRYRLPANAYGPIRDVLYVDAEGNETSMGIMDLEDLGRPEERRLRTRGTYRHYIDGDFIGLDPLPTATEGTLRIRYYRAPNKLILAADAWTIFLVSFVAVGPIPPVILQLTYGSGDPVLAEDDAIDFISAGNAHAVLYEGAVIDSVQDPDEPSGTQTVLTAEALATPMEAAGVAAGDYVALAGTTPVVQLPDFMVPVLVRRVAASCLRADGDNVAADKEESAAARLMEKSASLLIPRTEAEAPGVGCRNSPLRVMGG